MINRSRILYLLFSLVVAAGAFAAPSLTGTWITTVTPPPDAGVPAFKLIFTFNEDGTLIATGNGGGLAPALGNPCQGGWRADANGIAITYYCLDFDSGLQYTGMDKIRGSVTIDASQRKLEGDLDLTNYDVNGDEVFSACCATVAGAKVPIERLPAPAEERHRPTNAP